MRLDLREADLSGADLRRVNLVRADLSYANLSGADLSHANLKRVNFTGTKLSYANLSEADMGGALLVETNFAEATLSHCRIYGIAAWGVELKGARQNNLIISRWDEPTITVDNLKIAQFIYLLLDNAEIRDAIDTIAKNAVLILGRFPYERKMVLDALKDEIRNQNHSPVVFNLEDAENRDFTATVRVLANMARFVLIDLTDLDEPIGEIANAIVPRCVVPIRPLLLQGSHQQNYELFQELQRKHRWVLAPYRYKDLPDLQTNFQENFLQPINEKIIELKQKKPLKIFIGYALEDKNTLKTLKTHLRPLEKAGLIELWDDQDVAPGEEKGKEIERQLSNARIILLLISPAFLGSHDCYDILLNGAIERHTRGEATVIPILLRPCAWQQTPLKKLQPLPRDGKPLSNHNKDEVFFEMSEEIGEVVKILR